jgi:hypothetical protein
LATRASEARSTEVRARAEANFKKEERAKEGAKAMMEYQANGRVVREQMARLKALRLAKEAQEAQGAKEVDGKKREIPAKSPAKSRAKSKSKAKA